VDGLNAAADLVDQVQTISIEPILGDQKSLWEMIKQGFESMHPTDILRSVLN